MSSRPLLIAAAAGTVVTGLVLYSWQVNAQRADHASLPGVPPTPLIPPDQVSRFVGSAACAGCHRNEHQSHDLTTHAHTLARTEDSEVKEAFRSTEVLRDPHKNANYTQQLRDGEPVCIIAMDGQSHGEAIPAKYAVGSGKIAWTFLYQQGDRFAEGRTSYYKRDGKWYWTPGQQDPRRGLPAWGKPLDERTAAACFLCHSTAVVHDGQRLQPEQSIFNVGCERCHGPGREHVQAVEQGKAPGPIYSLRNLSGEMVQKLCEGCHGPPIPLTEAELVKFPSLPRFAAPGLALSKCYKQSDGKLSCISCHDPHTKPSRDPRTYERVCLDCHSRPTQALCPVNPRDNCVKCHMPDLPVDFPVPMKFPTHWIKVYGKQAP